MIQYATEELVKLQYTLTNILSDDAEWSDFDYHATASAAQCLISYILYSSFKYNSGTRGDFYCQSTPPNPEIFSSQSRNAIAKQQMYISFHLVL